MNKGFFVVGTVLTLMNVFGNSFEFDRWLALGQLLSDHSVNGPMFRVWQQGNMVNTESEEVWIADLLRIEIRNFVQEQVEAGLTEVRINQELDDRVFREVREIFGIRIQDDFA